MKSFSDLAKILHEDLKFNFSQFVSYTLSSKFKTLPKKPDGSIEIGVVTITSYK